MKSKTFLGCSHKTRFSQFSESMPTSRSYFVLGNLEWILHSWNKVVKLWEVIYLLNVWYFQPSLLFFRSTIWNLWFVSTCFPFEIQFTFFCRHDWKETFFTSLYPAKKEGLFSNNFKISSIGVSWKSTSLLSAPSAYLYRKIVHVIQTTRYGNITTHRKEI